MSRVPGAASPGLRGRCPLCESADTAVHAQDGPREFVLCRACELVFVPPGYHLSINDEKARYALHDNSAGNGDYRAYLERVADALARIPLQSPRVLDFGSGPEAVLTRVLRGRVVACTAYDPLYGIGSDALGTRYDVVILCEVVEHLREPRQEFQRIRSVLAPGGWVVVRTQLRRKDEDLASWWYAKDPSHINFFGRRALEVAASLLGRRIVEIDAAGSVLIGPE